MRFSYLLRLLPFIRMKTTPPLYSDVQVHPLDHPKLSDVPTVLYNDYWTLDKYRMYKHEQRSNKTVLYKRIDPTYIEYIEQILDQFGPNYRRVYYLRYDKDAMYIKYSVRTICKTVGITPAIYYEWMHDINDRIRNSP